MHKIDELKENINDLRLMFQRYQSNVDMTLNNIMGSLHNTISTPTPTSTLLSYSTNYSTDTSNSNNSNSNSSNENNILTPNDIQITEKSVISNKIDDSNHDAFEIHDYNEEEFAEMLDDLDPDISEEDIELMMDNRVHNNIEISELSDVDIDMDIDVDLNNVELEEKHHIKKLELSDEDFSKIEKIAQSVNNNSIDIDNISNLDVGSIMMDDGEELVFDDIDISLSNETHDNINDKSEVSNDNKAVDETLQIEQSLEDLISEKVVETDEIVELPTDTIMTDNIIKTIEKKKNSKGGRGRNSAVKRS